MIETVKTGKEIKGLQAGDAKRLAGLASNYATLHEKRLKGHLARYCVDVKVEEEKAAVNLHTLAESLNQEVRYREFITQMTPIWENQTSQFAKAVLDQGKNKLLREKRGELEVAYDVLCKKSGSLSALTEKEEQSEEYRKYQKALVAYSDWADDVTSAYQLARNHARKVAERCVSPTDNPVKVIESIKADIDKKETKYQEDLAAHQEEEAQVQQKIDEIQLKLKSLSVSPLSDKEIPKIISTWLNELQERKEVLSKSEPQPEVTEKDRVIAALTVQMIEGGRKKDS